jgi:hypothetical protein
VLCCIALAAGAIFTLCGGVLLSMPTVLTAAGFVRTGQACDAMIGHAAPAGSPLALVAIVGTVSMGIVGMRGVLASRRLTRDAWIEPGIGRRIHGRPSETVVLDDARPLAQSVPGTSGRPNQVVLSTGLIDALTPTQVELVCAHEESHLRSGHGLHLVFARAVEASCWFWPPARSSVGVLRLALERSADEVAAGPTPQARKQLATALLAVAIGGPTTTLAFSALDGLMERVTAMGDPEWMVLPARWRPVIFIPGLLLGALALLAVARLGHSAYCLVTMAQHCRLT